MPDNKKESFLVSGDNGELENYSIVLCFRCRQLQSRRGKGRPRE